MKHILLKLTFLFVTLCLLTSSKKDVVNSNGIQTLNTAHTCLGTRTDYATAITCKQTPVALKKSEDAERVPVVENEISLSPISRFILLQ
jgi:hypothetical protein